MNWASGAQQIALERGKQRDLGYDEEHDNDHGPFVLLCAAKAYAESATVVINGDKLRELDLLESSVYRAGIRHWPWDDGFNPSSDAVENLVKAGALIAAAIDVVETRNGTRQDARA